MVSLALGWFLGSSASDLEQRIAFLEQQAIDRDADVLLSALTQTTASERIALLRRQARQASAAPGIDLIWRALTDDSNVNVRLTAVDCLYELPMPLKLETRVFQAEPSPLIRLALLDWLVSARPEGWRDPVLFAQEFDADQEVKERARWLLGRTL